MTVVARRTLQELALRYRLEPTLHDVFVEGSFDRDLISEWRRARGLKPIILYTSQTVDLGSDLLAQHGLSTGEKQRLVALACEATRLGHADKLTCIVDRDFDGHCGAFPENQALLRTDFCCLESYFWNAEIIRRIVSAAADIESLSLGDLMDSVGAALKNLFAIRLVETKKQLMFKWVPLKKDLSASAGRVSWNGESYLKRLLDRNGMGSELQRFREDVALVEGSLGSDTRNSMRGHDLTEILAFAIRALKGHADIGVPSVIERLMVVLAGDLDTSQFGMWSRLATL